VVLNVFLECGVCKIYLRDLYQENLSTTVVVHGRTELGSIGCIREDPMSETDEVEEFILATDLPVGIRDVAQSRRGSFIG
jgi:hypothetical protein